MPMANLDGRPNAPSVVTVIRCHIRSGTMQVAKLAQERVGGLDDSAMRDYRSR